MSRKSKLISGCLALSALFAAGGALTIKAPALAALAAENTVTMTIEMNGGFRITSRDVTDRNGETDDNRSTATYSEENMLVTEWNGVALTKGTELEFTYENIQQLFPYGAFMKYNGAVDSEGKAQFEILQNAYGKDTGYNYNYITSEGYYCPQLVNQNQFPTAIIFGLFEDSNGNGIKDEGEKSYYQGDTITLTGDVTLKCFYDPLFASGQRFSTEIWQAEVCRDRYIGLDLAADVSGNGGSYSFYKETYDATDMQPFCYEVIHIRYGSFSLKDGIDSNGGRTAIEFPSTVLTIDRKIMTTRSKITKISGLDNVTKIENMAFDSVGGFYNNENGPYLSIVVGDKIGLLGEGSLYTWDRTKWIFTGFDEAKLAQESEGKTTTPLGLNVQTWLLQNYNTAYESTGMSYNYFYVPYGETGKWYPTPENTSGYTQTYTGLHYGTETTNVPMREAYRVKFDLNGGKINGKNKLADEFIDAGSKSVSINGKEVNVASAANASLLKTTKPADPVKDGCTFVGWEDQFGYVWTEEDWTNGGKNDYEVATITLKAVFKTSVTVSFVTNSVQKVDAYLTYNGGFIKQPELTLVAGKTLDGWYTDESYETKWNFETDVAGTEDFTLYAKWTAAAYSVYLYDEVGSIGEEYVAEGEGENRRFTLTYSYGDSFDLPQSECEGYEFNGWYNDDDNKIENITAEDFGVFYLTAKWQAIYYKINYELNGGKNYYDNPDYYTKAEAVELQPARKTGYIFKGWYLDESFENAIDVIENRVGDITVYAAYEVDESAWFTITYNLNGGKNDDKNITEFLLRERVILYPATKDGFTFDGWYEDAEFTTKIDSIDTTLQKNYVLYAKFTVIEKVWNITYHLNGGTNSTYNAGTYIEGKGLTFYSPTLEGYKFDGWYTDKDFTNKIECVSEADSGDIEVYAKFISETKEGGCGGYLNGGHLVLFVIFGAMFLLLIKSRKQEGC